MSVCNSQSTVGHGDGIGLKEVVMPLSEHEQRLLDQLEQQLHATDPKFASALGDDRARTLSTRHIILGVLISIVGILVLLFGVTIQQIIVGVLGFLVMGVGVYVATIRRGTAKTPASDDGAKVGRSKTGFMSSLEDRWDERRRGE
ncbi:integral membrane protein [Renibacterium salmoninarum ATCC 33209]|uniref:Integral membrane protein n=2 Tax=Renibacterium salmoninarum TaxID=1646 RepID=A9WRF0_RENSM|nr:integral membrane protein [Renibacterium salmoninarum ATCC 33209]